MNTSEPDIQTALNNANYFYPQAEKAEVAPAELNTQLLEAILDLSQFLTLDKEENRSEIMEILIRIEFLIRTLGANLDVELVTLLNGAKEWLDLKAFNSDMYVYIRSATETAVDATAGEFQKEMITEYSREQLASMYRNILRKRDDSIRNAPTAFVADVNTFANPAVEKLELIDRRIKVMDATNSLAEKRLPHLEGMIAGGQIKRISQAVFDVRLLMSVLRDDLSAELRARLTNVLDSLKSLEGCEDSVITLENALNGIYETPLPGDFFNATNDEA